MQTQEHFKSLFSLGLTGMAVVPPDGGLFAANEVMCRMLGHIPGTFGDVTWRDLTHPDDWEKEGRLLERLQQDEGGSYVMDKRLRHRDGHHVHVKVSARYCPARNGDDACLLVLVDDITEHKTAEQQAIQERNRAANILEGTNAGTWDWDVRNSRLVINERWAQMLGFTVTELSPVTERTWSENVHPEDLPQAERALERLFARQDAYYDVEFRMRHKNGSWIWINARGKVVEWDGNGKPAQVSGTHLDITARKQAEERRLELERQILHAQKLESLGVLAGGIAHDFNNLLAAVLGYADLALKEVPPGSAAQECIQEAVKGAREAAELTRQMLAYSGKGRFVVRPLNLSALVEEMGRLLDVSISKKCALQYRFGPDLPAFEADASQVKQVIMNLVMNASDAIGDRPGVITVSTGTSVHESPVPVEPGTGSPLPPGRYVWLEVKDDGCGMGDETRRRIFDPFFSTKFAGRGLGLAAVMGIVRGHHGAVQLESQPGIGTIFRVLFPASDRSPSHEFRLEADGEDWSCSGIVLVVDDEPPLRRLAARMFAAMGFHVLQARNGAEAIDLFRKDKDIITLVLLDLTMPVMDGLEAFVEMSRIKPGVKVILCSGFSEMSAVPTRAAGPQPPFFIQKPFTFGELVRMTRKAVEG